MPKWSNEIPDDPRGPALPIRRTPARKPMEAIVTSFDLIGCFTHFYKGQTVPCEGEDCPAHQEGIPFRWHAYVTACDFFTHMHFIFECTAISAEFFTAFRDKYMSLRGCHFKATRWNNRPNGRILIRTQMADLDKLALPEPVDLKKCMAILWNLPMDDVDTDFYDQQTRMRIAGTTNKRKPKK